MPGHGRYPLLTLTTAVEADRLKSSVYSKHGFSTQRVMARISR